MFVLRSIDVSGEEKIYHLVYFFHKWAVALTSFHSLKRQHHHFYPGKKAAHDSIRVQPFYG